MHLIENPFHLLGASPRDDRRRLLELAEERSLSQDPAVCAQARADLTNPRNRLAAEVAWLPGMDPVQAGQAVVSVRQAAAALRKEERLPALARANLLAAALPGMEDPQSVGELPTAILELAALQEACDAERIRTLINEERAVAGFPEVRETSAVAEALAERRRHYRTALKEALDVLAPLSLVRIITQVVTEATARGTRPAPALIDDLVDTYEVEAQRFLEAEAHNVELLLRGLRQGVEKKRPREALERLLSCIHDVVLNWYWVAQPIQLIAMSRGRDHVSSQKLAGEVRQLAVELINERGMLEESRFLMDLLRDAFMEVPRVAEVTGEDVRALEEIARTREAAQQQRARDIAYSGLMGTSSQEPFSLSTRGIDWQGTHWPLESITHIRWGGITDPQSARTRFSIIFGNLESSSTVTTDDPHVFSTLTQKLWRAVGTRLLTEMLTELGNGRCFVFGNAVVDDYGIEITHDYEGVPGVFMTRRPSTGSILWYNLQVESSNGALRIRDTRYRGTLIELPYLSVDNVPVLEAAIRALLETRAPVQMSNLLRK